MNMKNHLEKRLVQLTNYLAAWLVIKLEDHVKSHIQVPFSFLSTRGYLHLSIFQFPHSFLLWRVLAGILTWMEIILHVLGWHSSCLSNFSENYQVSKSNNIDLSLIRLITKDNLLIQIFSRCFFKSGSIISNQSFGPSPVGSHQRVPTGMSYFVLSSSVVYLPTSPRLRFYS